MFDIKENLKKLPSCPGVYLHKDKLGKVIYVGKAISLKNRVRQYFQSSALGNPKVRALVGEICEFEYITCGSEMEALILECNLIKKYRPKYNILLRDDKSYPSIKVTLSDEYPRIVKTREKKKDGNRYFGPYTDVGAVNNIVELLNDIYKLKRCTLNDFPQGFRPCLHYHINQCSAPCIRAVSVEEYSKNIDSVINFLRGNGSKILDYLQGKMTAHAEILNFEQAAVYRDYIANVKSMLDIQRATVQNGGSSDLIFIAKDVSKYYGIVFYVREGKLSGRESYPLSGVDSEEVPHLLSEFIKQYYYNLAPIPSEILTTQEPQDKDVLVSMLENLKGGRVRITVPQKGDKRKLLNMAQNDVQRMVETLSEKEKLKMEKQRGIREEISGLLELAAVHSEFCTPKIMRDEGEEYRIESYDISNTNGIDSVGAMVVFKGLEKVRKDYRRFRIKTVKGPDDYGSMEEIIERRFMRFEKGDPAFAILPDLILMDGGLGQVHAAEKVLTKLGFNIPVMGLAKDDFHRSRAVVFSDGYEIVLKNRPILFKYLGTLQEEVHRYAIEYHRKLRGKSQVMSVLDSIEGIGSTRRNALLVRFGSVDRIKEATLEELKSTPTLNAKAADKVYDFFHRDE